MVLCFLCNMPFLNNKSAKQACYGDFFHFYRGALTLRSSTTVFCSGSYGIFGQFVICFLCNMPFLSTKLYWDLGIRRYSCDSEQCVEDVSGEYIPCHKVVTFLNSIRRKCRSYLHWNHLKKSQPRQREVSFKTRWNSGLSANTQSNITTGGHGELHNRD